MRYWVIITLLMVVVPACAKEQTQQALNSSSGPQGSQGVAGITGATGNSGTVITPIEFCPSIIGNFPESGLCIDNLLYAVYWNGNNPHLTLITPGNYVTTDGRACSFTLVSGCTVL